MISDMSWSTMSTEVPASGSLRSVRPARRSRSGRGRRPVRRAAGAGARTTSARPRATTWRSPLDRSVGRRSATSSRSSSSRMQWVSLESWDFGHSASVMVDHHVGVWAATRRLSRTVRSSNSSIDWKVRTSPARARSWVAAREVAVEADVASAGLLEAGQGVDEGGLAGPVGSDESDDLPGLDGQRDVLERRRGPRGGHHQVLHAPAGSSSSPSRLRTRPVSPRGRRWRSRSGRCR